MGNPIQCSEKISFAVSDWTKDFSHTWKTSFALLFGQNLFPNENLRHGFLVSKSQYLYNKSQSAHKWPIRPPLCKGIFQFSVLGSKMIKQTCHKILYSSHRQPTLSELNPVSVAWGNWEYYYSPALEPQATHTAGASPSFCGMRQLGVLLLPCTRATGNPHCWSFTQFL